MTDQTPQFVRYRARIPNARGVKVGIFALANGLAQDGRLAVEDEAWLREANDWYNRAYPNPSDIDPGVYDRVVNPGAVSWFKVGASDALIERLADYVRLLDAHSVEWERVVTARPGRIVYEDEVQVVAVPERGDRALVRVCSRAWGHGFAREACVPVLRWAQREVTDGAPIIAVTQAANTRSLELLRALGMVERERFVEFGAPQVLMVWSGEDSATVRWGHDGVSG